MTRLLQEYITQQAQLRPDAVAIVSDGTTITYGALDQQSNRLAHQLQASGCRRGDRVCLFLPKSPWAVIGMLGAMKADCAYVPIDLGSPAARVAHVAQSCQPKCILVVKAAVQMLDEVLAVTPVPELVVGSLEASDLHGSHFATEFQWTDIEAQPATELTYANTSEDPAHILFTSGSTGIPKGVVIKHSNVIAFVDWGREYFQIGPDDRCSNHPPLHFDLSTFDIYGTLSAGAQLHMVPAAANLLPQKLAEFIRTSQLTQWFSVPAILTLLAKYDVVSQNDFPVLKRLLWCGEVLPTPTLIHWMQRLPHVTFTNLYGPTEATIASSYYTLAQCPADAREEIPIGTPCPGESLLVLDDHLRPVPQDEIGNLYIQGVGLSPGYWRDAEKTANAFQANPACDTDRIYKTGDLAKQGPDGLIYFLGRADSQIKSRGYRIELGEIETAFNALEYLKESAVVGVPTDGFEGTAICCAYVPQAGKEVLPPKMRKDIAKLLPSYMVPMRWKALEALPKNANGKIDKPKIREIFQQDAAVLSVVASGSASVPENSPRFA